MRPRAAERGFRAAAIRAALVGVVIGAPACTSDRIVDLGQLDAARKPGGGTAADGAHVFIESGAGDDAPARFAAASEAPEPDPKRSPHLVYPCHETMLAPNVWRVRHAWTPGEKNHLFEVEIVGPRAKVRIYTKDPALDPTEEQWRYIAGENAGGELSVSVRGLDPKAPDEAFRSERITLYVSEQPLPSSVYYWLTGAEGITSARTSDDVPQKFYPEPLLTTSECAGCHTLSRDGKKLAVIYEGEELEVVSVPERRSLFGVRAMKGTGTAGDTPDPMAGMPGTMPDPAFEAAWASFSPDGNRLVVSSHGKLRLLSATTGEPVGSDDGTIVLPDETFATHPDWSPKGDRLAATFATKGNAKEVEGGSIAVLPYDGESFGEAQILVTGDAPDQSDFFPSFSPDGRYLAFVEAKGKSRDADKASLRLLDTETGALFDLPRLNQRVNDEDSTMPLGNSMPVFVSAHGDAPPYFVAFSSLRAYADVRPADKKVDQLFLAAVDPSLADPGYAAFWAPFQSLDHGNHRAFFTDDATPTACGCVEVCDNGLDDDCDGDVDEPDCLSSCETHEICGDGVDNDCNCVIDDCVTGEVCNDGIDNDGDGQIDLADPSCEPR